MGLDTSYDNIREVLSLLQRYKQKIIVHNGDNYTNKFYNMIYLDVNNKVKHHKTIKSVTRRRQKRNLFSSN
jgi:predicted DNA-binding protein YlxM (UPF0122 family)